MPTSNAGLPRPARRPGRESACASRRRWRCAPSRPASRGRAAPARSSYADRPATMAVPIGADLRRRRDRLERLVGRLLRGRPGEADAEVLRPRCPSDRRAGSGGWRSCPCSTRSTGRCRCAPRRTPRASRAGRAGRGCGPAYQSRSVCEPDTMRGQVGAAAAADPGQAGQAEVGVLDDGAGQSRPAGPAARRRGAARQCGAAGLSPALAVRTADDGDTGGDQRRRPAAGTSQRRHGRRSKRVMPSACRGVAVRSLRTCGPPQARVPG